MIKEKNKWNVEIFLSVISIILVLLTLLEMKQERTNAYKPDITLGTSEAAIAWSETGVYDESLESLNIVQKMINEDVAVNEPPKIKVYNIGVGTAKNVKIEWDNDHNIRKFKEILKDFPEIQIQSDDKMTYIQTNAIAYATGSHNGYKYDFIMNSEEKSFQVSLPRVYFDLIKEAYVRNPDLVRELQLRLGITFTDIQGKSYLKDINVVIDSILYSVDADKSGYCVYNLIPLEVVTKMSLTSIDSDMSMLIVSILAFVVSVISLACAIKFNKSQIIHNKNSVRPISAIKIGDYEDNIYVKLENVGTGPLRVIRMTCQRNGEEFSELISMMPSIEQEWATFVECIDGWTIPVGGEIILVRIEPEDDFTRNLLRESLSNITIALEYQDVYGTKFSDSKLLDFFGRHFDK